MQKLSPPKTSPQLKVYSTEQGILVVEADKSQWYNSSFIIVDQSLCLCPEPTCDTDFDERILQLCLEQNRSPELVLVGMRKVKFQPKLLYLLNQKKIGLEIMPLKSACLTYKILQEDLRAFIGLFLFN